MTETVEAAAAPARKVGLLLGLGIFLLPFIFAWFTLRKGHTALARAVSFIWMVVVLLAGVFQQPAPDYPTTSDAASAPADPVAAAAAEAEAARERIERNPETALALTAINGTKAGFETVLELSGTITNSSGLEIKDAKIVCDLLGPSGTQVGTVRQTLFEIIPANGSKRFRELNMGFMGSTQVSNFSCRIIDADLV